MINYLSSSIGKKQLIAISGLAMVGFLVVHLLGNFLMYLGPEAINSYAKKVKKRNSEKTKSDVAIRRIVSILMIF